MNGGPQPQQPQPYGKGQAVVACNFCRASHLSCDGMRPCHRCVMKGKADRCSDVAPRKRGRPSRNDPRFRPKYPVQLDSASPSREGHLGDTRPGQASASAAREMTGMDPEFERTRYASMTYAPHHHHHQHQQSAPTSYFPSSSTMPSGMHGTAPWERDPDSSPGNDYDDFADDGEGHEYGTSDDSFASSPRHGSTHDGLHNNSSSRLPPGETNLAASMLAMMADEVQRLRQENAQLKSKVKKWKRRALKRQKHAEDIKGEPSVPTFIQVPSFVQTRPSATCTRLSQEPPSTANHIVPRAEDGLEQARRHMPFLNDYSFTSCAPIVGDIDGLAVAATEATGTDLHFTYVTDALANALLYSVDELKNMTVTSIYAHSDNLKVRIKAYLMDQPPWSVSDIFTATPLLRRKDGSTIRATANMQFFFGPDGQVKHMIMVHLHWELDTLRDYEHFKAAAIAYEPACVCTYHRS